MSKRKKKKGAVVEAVSKNVETDIDADLLDMELTLNNLTPEQRDLIGSHFAAAITRPEDDAVEIALAVDDFLAGRLSIGPVMELAQSDPEAAYDWSLNISRRSKLLRRCMEDALRRDGVITPSF
jgi:hypothetical protein